MKIDSNTPQTAPTNPFHIARAYNINQAARAREAQSVQAPERTSGADKLPSQAQRLVAAVVPGKIDFSGATPRVGSESLPLYRHPADRNVAATGVALGRSLDIQG